MRRVAAIVVLILAALPPVVQPNWLVGVPAVLAGLLGLLGVGWLAIGLLRAAGVTALIAYTLALSPTAAPISLTSGAVLGLALLGLLALIDFAGRFAGAAIDPGVVRAQIRFWATQVALFAAALLILSAAAGLLGGMIPSPGRAVVAGAGGLVAFAAAIGALLTRSNR